ncbi:MAG: DUF3168 domain-containing protein [Gemmataceae bacterium]
MASLIKDLETHLLLAAPVRGLVGRRVYGTQIPDRQPLPYVRVEKASVEFERFSTGKFEKAEVVITAYGETSEQAEALGRAVLARLEAPLFVSQPPRQTIDCRPQDDATTAESERGKDGLFRYAVPLTVRTTVYVPRS